MVIRTILIVADDSRFCREAVAKGYKLAADLGARVVLLYVIDEALAIGDPDAGIFPEQAMASLKRKVFNCLEKYQSEQANGVSTELLMPVGLLGRVLPGVLKSSSVDLVVAPVHPTAGIMRLLNGSSEDTILHISTVPVLFIPAG